MIQAESMTSESVKPLAESFMREVVINLKQPRADISIGTGLSGLVLVLIEIYGCYGQQQVLELAEEAADELVARCKRSSSNDYSLYTGYAGVVYVLLKLYGLTGKESRKAECLQLLQGMRNDYISSPYVTNYLYNGRAGTLLTVLLLHQATGEAALLEYINTLARKIIDDAYYTNEGLCWKNKEELPVRPSCAFATGTAGIDYVFRQLHEYFPLSGFDLVSREISRYTDYCWVEEAANWGNYNRDITTSAELEQYSKYFEQGRMEPFTKPSFGFSWGEGTAGIALQQIHNAAASHEKIRAAIENLSSSFQLSQFPAGVYHGLAGIALFCDKAYQHLQLPVYGDMRMQLEEHLLFNYEFISLKGGLFHGRAGVLYFLLKSIHRSDTDNIMCPLLAPGASSQKMNDWTLPETKQRLLSTAFRRTITVLNGNDSEALQQFINSTDTSQPPLQQFTKWVESHIEQEQDGMYKNALAEIYRLEADRAAYRDYSNRSDIQRFFERLHHRRAIVGLLNQPDAWVLVQTACLAPGLDIRQCRWDWTSPGYHTFFENKEQRRAPGNPGFEILLELSPENEIAETNLAVTGLILHRFDSPKQIQQAIGEIRFFCQSQPVENLSDIIRNAGSRSVTDFFSRLEFLVLFKVKELLYNGQLQIC